MAGEKTAHDPEAQSGSLLGLSRKKGFKNSRQNASGNARARVGNGEAYTVDRGVPPTSRRVDRDGQASAARHGFDRIQQQVVDDLAHFVGKTQDGLSFGDFSSDSNAPAVKFSAEYLQGLVEGSRNIDIFGERARTIVRKTLLDDARHARQFRAGDAHEMLCFWVQARVVFQQIQNIRDRREGIVDLVCQGSRELAGGGQLFSFAQALLVFPQNTRGLPEVGDVTCNFGSADDSAGRVSYG